MVACVVLLRLAWIRRRRLVYIVLIKLTGLDVPASPFHILINILIIWGRGDGTAEVKLGEVC